MKYWIFFLCIISQFGLFAQDSAPSDPDWGDEAGVQVGLTGHLGYFPATQQNNFQIGMELGIPIAERLSLLYSLSLGTNQYRKYAAHTSLGMYVGGWMANKGSNAGSAGDYIGFVGIVTLIMPEGIALHIPVNKRIRSSICLKPLGMEYNMYNDNRWNFSSAAALRFELLTSKKLAFSPEIGARYIAKHPTFSGGQNMVFAGLGISFADE